mmetsp:Transcript_6410/g.15847  ORF Transcript_6410/g.15847 Transcript_6410/m.15847 type:complete len:229 (-) Transcript_6410:744-1430(-)
MGPYSRVNRAITSLRFVRCVWNSASRCSAFEAALGFASTAISIHFCTTFSISTRTADRTPCHLPRFSATISAPTVFASGFRSGSSRTETRSHALYRINPNRRTEDSGCTGSQFISTFRISFGTVWCSVRRNSRNFWPCGILLKAVVVKQWNNLVFKWSIDASSYSKSRSSSRNLYSRSTSLFVPLPRVACSTKYSRKVPYRIRADCMLSWIRSSYTAASSFFTFASAG